MFENKNYKPWAVGEDWGIEIVEGFYKGVTVQITELRVKEDEENNEEGNMTVDYHVINKPENLQEGFDQDSQFSVVFSMIIEDIIREAVGEDTNNES